MPDTFTAHKLTNRFHVKFTPELAVHEVAVPILTEAGEVIQTESSQDISMDGYTTSIQLLTASRIGVNVFRATGAGGPYSS